MCIERISNNIFPFNKKPTSIIATSAAVVALVAGILVGIACYMHWGMPAIGSLSAACGLSALVTLVIVFCRLPTAEDIRVNYEREHPLPSQLKPSLSIPPQAVRSSRHDIILQQLYTLVQQGDIDTFEKAIQLYSADNCTMMSVNSITIILDDSDTTTSLPLGRDTADGRAGRSLFFIIFMLKDQASRVQFLKALLPKIKDHVISLPLQSGYKRTSYMTELLKIQDPATVSLLLAKLDDGIKQILDADLTQEQEEQRFIWIDTLIDTWTSNHLHEMISTDRLIWFILNSHITTPYRQTYLVEVARQLGSTPQRLTFETWYIGGNRVKCNILHLAIVAKQPEIVRIYLNLWEKPSHIGKCAIPTLLLAVWAENLEIVQILLRDAKARPDDLLINKDYWYDTFVKEARRGSTQITPLMLASMLGREDIANALLEAGANESLVDQPGNADAWGAAQYLAEFIRLDTQYLSTLEKCNRL